MVSPGQPLADSDPIHQGIDGMHIQSLLKKASTLGEEISSQLQLLASFPEVRLPLIISQLGINLGTFQQGFCPLLKIASLVAELIALLVDCFCFLFGDGGCHRCKVLVGIRSRKGKQWLHQKDH